MRPRPGPACRGRGGGGARPERTGASRGGTSAAWGAGPGRAGWARVSAPKAAEPGRAGPSAKPAASVPGDSLGDAGAFLPLPLASPAPPSLPSAHLPAAEPPPPAAPSCRHPPGPLIRPPAPASRPSSAQPPPQEPPEARARRRSSRTVRRVVGRGAGPRPAGRPPRPGHPGRGGSGWGRPEPRPRSRGDGVAAGGAPGGGAPCEGDGAGLESGRRGCLRNVTLGPKPPGPRRSSGRSTAPRIPPGRGGSAPSDPCPEGPGPAPRPPGVWSEEGWSSHRAGCTVPFPTQRNGFDFCGPASTLAALEGPEVSAQVCRQKGVNMRLKCNCNPDPLRPRDLSLPPWLLLQRLGFPRRRV